jgi:hypothetical protein
VVGCQDCHDGLLIMPVVVERCQSNRRCRLQ